MIDEALLQRIYEARDKYCATLGEVSPDVLAPIVNPSFMGGPTWPNLRQAWQVIHRGSSTIIISDGLSDPFEDKDDPNTGFGLEILVESADSVPEEIHTSWLFKMVDQVSQQCAHHGGVRDLIDRAGLLSLEFPKSSLLSLKTTTSSALEAAGTARGTVGVMLGVAPPGLPGSSGFAEWRREGCDGKAPVAVGTGIRNGVWQSRAHRTRKAICL